MDIDLMTGPSSWNEAARLAMTVQAAGFSGLCFTETSQVPWMQIAAASMAADHIEFSTGIAVAFPRSPMVTAAIAHELAANTDGRFRLGLGSQVKAHVERRYSSDFERPAARLRDYVLAVKACFRAFNREERLSHEGDFYNMSLLPRNWSPAPHAHPMRVDISAVGPMMTRVAGEVADGIHVHPFHSMHYVENRLLPDLAAGAEKADRTATDIDLLFPVLACPGDSPEDRAPYIERTRQQIAFYGSTKNYGFQFDDLGFEGVSAKLNQKLKAGDMAGMADTITDEMLEHFAVVATWDEMPNALLSRYRGTASRLIMYTGRDELLNDVNQRTKWCEVATAVREAD